MQHVRIALDWTANTNHTGFYVARELGFYADVDLELTLITPDQDNYEMTPAKKLELGLADFALAPFESVISLHTKKNNVPVQAIAALLQEDISAIVALRSSAITRPKELDGRTYASYRARYEDSIIKQMIISDGGTGNVQVVYPEKLGIWNTLLTNAADSTWIFDNWEGVEADTSGVELTRFRLADYQIPYAYSPVIVATRQAIEQNRAVCGAFVNATKKGFLHAIENPQAAVTILTKYVPERDIQAIDLVKSQAYTAGYYGDEGSWGKMDASRIQRFVDWLYAHELETEKLAINQLYTNDLIH
ncbi:ABC transporter substrate-binding protein [uncultured Fibrella sp.]|uniref:ABC transporter substrate-binding protein n=1 Tax=uncultured Fibrella sp. TaxID=1284596 RepID=UPI0035CBF468